MAIIIGNTKKPIEYHLATEEYLLRDYDLKEDILYLWVGSKAFVFGRNQNPYIEIHPKYLMDDSIPKYRRVSGGGTIYQDEGTINVSIITKHFQNKINDYHYFLKPLIKLLRDHGLNASFKPKSHVYVDDLKVSGNAQAFINNRLLHHGTLLFDTDLDVITNALVRFQHSAKGHFVLSNKQNVVNIKPYLNVNIDDFLTELKDRYIQSMSFQEEDIKIDELRVQELIDKKYHTWTWNYGHTPRFDIDVIYQQEPITITVEHGKIVQTSLEKAKHFIGQAFDIKSFQ